MYILVRNYDRNTNALVGLYSDFERARRAALNFIKAEKNHFCYDIYKCTINTVLVELVMTYRWDRDFRQIMEVSYINVIGEQNETKQTKQD